MNGSTLDLVLLGVLLLSALVGLWRGLVFEVLSLAGWVAAYIAAQAFGSSIAHLLPIGTPGSALNHAAGFALVFVLVLVLWSILARLVRALIHATPLSAIDRLLGGVFGLLRGLVLLLAVATLVLLTPLRSSTAWQQSRTGQGLQLALHELKPYLPGDLARHLPA